MICFFCRKAITGADLKRRVEWRQVDGQEFIYGDGMPDGNLSDAAGPLVKTAHHKCYFASVKRAQLVAARAAETEAHPAATDWRDQEELDVEALRGVDGDHRGAGAPPARVRAG